MEAMGKCVYLICTFLLIVGCCASLETHSVTTGVGDIVGFNKKLLVKNEEKTVRRYLGIPFAKPPVGDLRFKKPVPLEKFSEPFEALNFGAACQQLEVPVFKILDELSEDCLFLNIYVPTSSPDKPSGHPVMIFIHGGGFDMGTGNTYIGDTLASFGNVIVVTINYRLGLFGFLSTENENAPGNAALWDQHLAFKWVHNNIGAFGGDNGRVTIFGESAGAASVLMQALYPGNKGLFQRVIAQSGSALMHGTFTEDPSVVTAKLAEAFNCEVDDIVSCMNRLNSSAITGTMTELFKEDMAAAVALSFRPTVDNDFFKMPPFEMAKKQDEASEEITFFRSIDVINGVNSAEGAMFVGYFSGTNGSDTYEPTREIMNTQLVPASSAFFTKEGLTDLVTKLILNEYTDWSNPDDPKTIRAEFSRLMGDVFFNVGAVEQTRIHDSSQETGRNFFYIFDADTNVSFLRKPKWCKGAIHGEELGFVFGFDDEMFEQFKLSVLERSLEDLVIQEWERDLGEQIMRYWSNFAAYGDPNGLDKKDPEWPQYDLETQKTIVIYDKHTAIESFPYARSADFWNNIIPAAFNASRKAPESEPVDPSSGSCSAEGDCDGV